MAAKRLIHLIDDLGELARLEADAIVAIGGIEATSFGVNNTGVILEDGTSSLTGERVIQIGTVGAVGYEHIQSTPATLWIVNHNKSSKRVQLTIWDPEDEMILPDTVKIVDRQTVHVTFNTALTGRAVLMMF